MRTTKTRMPSPAVMSVVRLAANGRTNQEIAKARNVSVSTVNSQMVKFYEFVDEAFPESSPLTGIHNETQRRQALPQLLRVVLCAFPALSESSDRDLQSSDEARHLTPIGISGVGVDLGAVHLDFASRSSAPIVGSILPVLLEEKRVDDILILLKSLFLDRHFGRAVTRQLFAISEPARIRSISDTYVTVLDKLQIDQNPAAIHARAQGYWQLAGLDAQGESRRDIIALLKNAAQRDINAVPKVAAGISLGAMGFTDYVKEAAEHHSRIASPSAARLAGQRHAYSLAYAGDQPPDMGRYEDSGSGLGERRFLQGIRHLNGGYDPPVHLKKGVSNDYLRPLVLQELAFHIRARPRLLFLRTDLRTELINSLEELETVDQLEESLACQLRRLVH